MNVSFVKPVNTPSICTNRQKDILGPVNKRQSNRINFKGQDFLDLSEENIYQRIKTSLNSENFLGQGSEAEVYRIKGTKYCVRLPHGLTDIYKFYTKELTPMDKVNHIVAKLGFGASIMKYFSGQTPKEHRDNSFSRYKFQEKIADMPIRSYTELLHQIADAINNEMIFDCTGGNLIVDLEKNKLIAIDFFKIPEENRSDLGPLSKIYSILTYHGAEEKTGKRIFDKIIRACLKEFQPNNIPSMDIELFDFRDLCIKRINDNYDKNKKLFSDEFFYIFEKLKKVKKAEIVDKTFSATLEKQINKVLNLTKKIY